MSEFDDRKEHRYRSKFALSLGSLLGLLVASSLLGTVDFSSPHWWVSCTPFMLAGQILVYGFTPYPDRRLGSRPHGSPPRLLRPGNPVLRQSSGASMLLLGLFLASFIGCTALMGVASADDPMSYSSIPLMYFTLGLIFITSTSTCQWLELDVDSLRVVRHRVTHGLQRSNLQGDQAIRALGACRTANMGAYNVFAFTQEGQSLPVGQEKGELAEVQFEAERLADQLMVPLLVGVEQQNCYNIARNMRGRGDESLPLRRDWMATGMPDGLAEHRSLFPPID